METRGGEVTKKRMIMEERRKKERKAVKMIVIGKKKGKGEVNGGTERKLKEASRRVNLRFRWET